MVIQLCKKICVIGEPGVGKTSLIGRFVYNMFDDTYLHTIGANVSKKDITLEIDKTECTITMMLWDIAGQRTFSFVQPTFYRNSDGAFFVCDITRKETLEAMDSWLGTFWKINPNAHVKMLVNKKDLIEKAKFDIEDIKKKSEKNRINYFLTSAKTGESVDTAFYDMAKSICKSHLSKKEK